MTFKDVVRKNFFGHIRRYVSYFLCTTFAIMIFFMYSTLVFNENMKKSLEMNLLNIVFLMAMIAISLFAIFFVNYAHSSFLRMRNKEFGVYISLGMTNVELKKMVQIENLVICGTAFISGVGIGALFSRLFQMIVLKLLNITNIKFYMDYRAFLLTFIVFFLIFLSVFGISSYKMNHCDIAGLLQEQRKSEGTPYRKRDAVFGSLGFLLMLASIVLLVIIANNEKIYTKAAAWGIYLAIAFLGVYCFIIYGGNQLIHWLKNTMYYTTHLLEVSELHYRFTRNKKVIFILSLLSTMTIYLVASPFSLLRLSKSIVEMNANDIEFIETREENHTDHKQQLFKDSDITEHRVVPFIYLTSRTTGDENIILINTKEYNKRNHTSYQLKNGEAMNMSIDWMPGDHGIKTGSRQTLYLGEHEITFKIADAIRGEFPGQAESFQAHYFYLVNDSDYERIVNQATRGTALSNQVPKNIQNNIGYFHMIQTKNWEDSEKIVSAFEKNLSHKKLPVRSRIRSYQDLKQGYSAFLFVSSVLGVLFFVSGGMVLYFKQFTELQESQMTYQKLFKVGITNREIKKVIGWQLRVIFFMPLIFGSFLGVSLIYLMTFFVGGQDIIREFIQTAFIMIGIYFAAQSVFYWITRNRYTKAIIKN